MNEYMLLIYNEIDHQATWSEATHTNFLKSCQRYIETLKTNNNLIVAQPLIREGLILSKVNDTWIESAFNETKEVQVGYYHIVARDITEAIEIAKGNPEFEFSKTARIEIRPIKIKEEKTGYVYPKNKVS